MLLLRTDPHFDMELRKWADLGPIYSVSDRYFGNFGPGLGATPKF